MGAGNPICTLQRKRASGRVYWGDPCEICFSPPWVGVSPVRRGPARPSPHPLHRKQSLGLGAPWSTPSSTALSGRQCPVPGPHPLPPTGCWNPRLATGTLGSPRRAAAPGEGAQTGSSPWASSDLQTSGSRALCGGLSLQGCRGLCPSHWDWGLPLGRCDAAPPHCVCDWREFDRPILCFSRHGPPV